MTLLEEGARTDEIAHIEVDLSATPQTKQLHRTIMLTAAYQMSSHMDARSFAQDGDNRIWRLTQSQIDAYAKRQIEKEAIAV